VLGRGGFDDALGDAQWLDLTAVDFRRADLRHGRLGAADLRFAALQRAYLGGPHLEGAHLEGSDLEGARVVGAYPGGSGGRCIHAMAGWFRLARSRSAWVVRGGVEPPAFRFSAIGAVAGQRTPGPVVLSTCDITRIRPTPPLGTESRVDAQH
jgi:uncharacterized protein YjbI with pentapeptide repeats